jgi:hypothetical protein
VSETRHAHEGKKRELKFKKTIEKNCVEEIIARTWIIFFFKLRDCSGQAQKDLETYMDKN